MTKSFYGKNLTVFSNFGGVDFSSSPLDVDAHRASDMENFISDFGILKKRNGYRQIREFSDAEGNRLSVCGIFHYKTDKVSHIIVHAGEYFFRLTENGYERIGAKLTGLTATRSEAYAQKERMYIIGCGDYLVYGTWDGGSSYELRRVYDDEDTYIPVTTINISSSIYSDRGVSGVLDDVNLLTPRRKNRLNGVVIRKDETETPTYYYNIEEEFFLDSPIEMLSKVTVKVMTTGEEIVFEDAQDAEFTDADGFRAGYRHIDALGNLMMVFDDAADIPTGSFTITRKGYSGTYTCSGGNIKYSGYGSEGKYTIDGSVLRISNTKNSALFTNGTFVVGGYTVDIPIKQEKTLGKATYTLNYLNSSLRLFSNSSGDCLDIEYHDGEDVFEVTFRAIAAKEDGVVPYPERIKSCRFGTLFGVDGASDRLFLTGNPLLKNVEFFSEIDDFTYFPDTYTVTIGSGDIPVVGYLRLSDGTLAVFKEKRDMGDATIYYRTGHYKQYSNEDGDLDRIDAVFPTVAGNTGESMISRFATADFGGDKLFLSENGVFAVVLSENIAVGERYTRERSRMVNARLTKEKELSEAVAIVYKNKYYLAVNGNVYVADSRYRSTRSDNMDGAWGYEWWFLTGIPACVFAQVNGELWFGTKDGQLCRFDEGYTDRTYTLYAPGDLSFCDRDGCRGIVVNKKIKPSPAVGDSFMTNDDLYGVAYTGFSHANDGRVYHTELATVAKMAEGERVYVKLADGSLVLEEDTPYEIRDIDLLSGSFALYRDGVFVPADTASFSLMRSLRGLELEVTLVDGNHFFVGLFGETLNLVRDSVALLGGKLTHKQNVRARWVSTVTNLGTAMAGKNLHRLSISCEPTVRGRLTFGYDARLNANRKVAEGYSGTFSFDSLDFSAFSFETGFASSYSVRIFERNVNYVALVVESDTDTACAFNRLEMLWSYNRLLGGLR